MSLADLKLADFHPKLPWWGGDLQTIRNYATSVNLALPRKAARRIEVPLEDGSGDRLIGALHLPGHSKNRPLVALIHGIAGSEASCYVIAAGAYFLARGYPVLRVNLRGAGPSRPYCRHQYHAGHTDDFALLLDRLDPRLTRNGVMAVGFSLGGNLLLKYLGEVGRHTRVRRAATVSAPLDLRLASRTLMRWRNFAYHRYIVTNLKRSCTAPGAVLSAAERKTVLAARSLWQLDHEFTAPRNGYTGAEDYYGTNSSREFLGGVRKPTLMIHAQDDPFVPIEPYLESRWQDQPWLTLMLPRSGGHLGFHEPAGIWYLRQIEAFFTDR